MRAVIQRVSNASVSVNNEIVSSIQKGFVILLGIEMNDTDADVLYLSNKIFKLRVFEDENDKMNKSISDVNGDLLLISQFTLYADTEKGNRPSFIRAARPEQAIPLYEQMISEMELLLGKKISTGVFGAHMHVQLINDGPVTIIIDSKEKSF